MHWLPFYWRIRSNGWRNRTATANSLNRNRIDIIRSHSFDMLPLPWEKALLSNPYPAVWRGFFCARFGSHPRWLRDSDFLKKARPC
ncbi:MAG: hypothetical protein EBV97_17240 [Rhodobacteraceae bacterium]|nr:hypothetical protein [Paracoccaceae bacterium]